jgi:hypothetical protein
MTMHMINRREYMRWGAAILGGIALGPAHAALADAGRPTEAEDLLLSRVRRRARDAKIAAAFDVETSTRFLGIGDAAREFRRKALDICEAMARDYFDHFKFRGYDVKPPDARMVVVILADGKAFEAFLGQSVLPVIRGIYSLDANYLVIFDQRTLDDNPNAARVNTIALLHETMHQLTYNTGLLNRNGDVPDLVSEGLGVYGEVRRLDGKTKIGAINSDRLALLSERRDSWISIAELFSNDPFDDPNQQQVAYAQAWVFTHYFLADPARRKAYQAYLDLIRTRPLPFRPGRPFEETDQRRADVLAQRQTDARSTLGDLNLLDQNLKRYAGRLFGRS